MSTPGFFLAFSLGWERYGVPIDALDEVIPMVALTPVPARAAGGAHVALQGLVDIGQRAIPVISVRQVFNLPADELTTATRIVITRAGGCRLGLIVDTVSGVVEIEPERLRAFEGAQAAPGYDYLAYVYQDGDGLVLLLDPARLFSNEELTFFARLSEDHVA